MATKNVKLQYNLQSEVVEFDGYVCLNSSAAIVTASTVFPNATVVKTTTGVYTITLADKFPSVVCVNANWAANATSSAIRCEVGPVITGGTTSVVVRTTDAAGAPADTSAAGGFWVCIKVKNTSISS